MWPPLAASAVHALSHAPKDMEPSDIDSTYGTSSRPLSSTRKASRAPPKASPSSVAAEVLELATTVLTPGAKAAMYEASSVPSTKLSPVLPFQSPSRETSFTDASGAYCVKNIERSSAR